MNNTESKSSLPADEKSVEAEQARLAVVNAGFRQVAKLDRAAAETERARAEVARAEARGERLAAENERLRAQIEHLAAGKSAEIEQLRHVHRAELARAAAETMLKAAETERVRTEALRAQASVERQATENALQAAEMDQLQRGVQRIDVLITSLAKNVLPNVDKNASLRAKPDNLDTKVQSEESALTDSTSLVEHLKRLTERLRIEIETTAEAVRIIKVKDTEALQGLRAEAMVAEADRQLNLVNMVAAMTTAEDNMRSARADLQVLRDTLAALAAQTQNLFGGGIIEQTRIFESQSTFVRRFFSRAPRAASLAEQVAERLRTEGDKARDAQEWCAAIGSYMLYLAARPNDFGIWVQLGHARKELGDRNGANNAYLSALAIEPNNADLLLNIGHLRKLQNDLDGALDFYSRSFDVNGNQYAADEFTFLRSQNSGAREYSAAGHPTKMRLLDIVGFVPARPAIYPDPWPSHRPLVTVVIPCFNYGHFVADAIASVLAQTFSNLEIIVVEGGSSSLDSRRQLAAIISPKTRILVQPTPTRAGANRNFGISHARGKYICCLDADDKLAPTYLEKALFIMENYEFDVVSCGLQYFGDRDDFCDIISRPDLEALMNGNHVLTCGVFRRDFWEKSGGYRDSDPKFGHIHEDWLFWMRLAALGARFFNISYEYLFYYRAHGISLSNDADGVPMDMQAKIVRYFNEDVFAPGVVERSRQLALEERRAEKPMRNFRVDNRMSVTPGPTILLAMPFLVVGGAERLLSLVMCRLSRAGWRVIILTSIPIGPEHGDSTEWFHGATAEIYHLPRFLAQGQWGDFIDYVFTTRQIDLLWIVGSEYFYELLPRLRAGYPKLRVCDLLFNTVGHMVNNRAHRSHIDMNICENSEVYNWLLTHDEAPERIRVIESGVNLIQCCPELRDRSIFVELRIPPTRFVVGFSGRWSEEKDPLGFVTIASLVPPELDIAFVMTGAGAMRVEIEAAIAAADFSEGRFHLVGLVDDILAHIASFDLLCLPSRVDGRPFVVLEALAAGVPVLASRVGALPELVSSGQNGMLCDVGDYAAFAREISRLGQSSEMHAKMKRLARQTAVEKLDAQTMLGKYERVLAELAA